MKGQNEVSLATLASHSRAPKTTLDPAESQCGCLGRDSQMFQVFAQFGLPETVVSDNATSFTSQEFESYLKLNAIRHTRLSPYHPS